VGLQEGGLFERTLRENGHPIQTPLYRTPQPELQASGGDREEVIRGSASGHFITDVHVNGTLIRFLIDTGATHIVLNEDDAKRRGLSGSRLRYNTAFKSANGTTFAAPVTLRDVRIGQLQLYDLDAYVNEGALDISLLGTSFLRQLRSYEVVRNRLVLRW
ncbi:MAG: retropepsin-like aspartic protease family protein, partial [Geminicoccaceae bacterium]